MSIQYASIVPWGRSFDEYTAMFALSAEDLGRCILGCGDGPSSFNAGMRQRGLRAVSVDPVYTGSAAGISRRIEETCADVVAQTERNTDKFVWDKIGDVTRLTQIRRQAMALFLEDFEDGKKQGRYVVGALPALPFAAKTFDIGLSSHFLFLYADQLSCDFHLQAITAMLRVAREARIFPVLDINGHRCPYLDAVTRHFRQRGYHVEEIPVDYEFQLGGNHMLRLWP